MGGRIPDQDDSMTTGIDVIGDVHGQAGMLKRLLTRLGYADDGRSWRHPSRTVVFIGDLIDRHHGQLEVLDIAQRMVAEGTARVVMGNHEFNAIAWATRHPGDPDGYLRPHSAKNRDQHQAFLEAVGEGSDFHHRTVDWFKALPLWLEIDGARFVHACWDPSSMAVLSPRLGAGNTLTNDLLVEAAMKHTPAYEAVEHLLKGPEVAVPKGYEYADKGGHERDHARFAWWNEDAHTLRRGALIPDGTKRPDGTPHPELPDIPIEKLPTAPYRDAVPLFVGHYWQSGTPELLSPRIACVDYSAGKNGPLVAYRWDGEPVLVESNFVVEDPTPSEAAYAKIADALAKSRWVPTAWRADRGRRTPSGWPALFRSNVHALMGLRILYLEQAKDASPVDLAERSSRYQHGWARFVQLCHEICAVVRSLEAGDLAAAAAGWNAIDQADADRAFRIVLGEREAMDGRSVATAAWRHFGLTSSSIPREDRDRSLRAADHDEAWARSVGGVCRGCGTPTISHAQRRSLHDALANPALGFDIEPTYVQHNDKPGPLWEQLTIAARGVAEHVTPWSQGGRTDVGNLTNACAGCNYARSDRSMDELGVTAYDRPDAERRAATLAADPPTAAAI